jgi:hypothetical protein
LNVETAVDASEPKESDMPTRSATPDESDRELTAATEPLPAHT